MKIVITKVHKTVPEQPYQTNWCGRTVSGLNVIILTAKGGNCVWITRLLRCYKTLINPHSGNHGNKNKLRQKMGSERKKAVLKMRSIYSYIHFYPVSVFMLYMTEYRYIHFSTSDTDECLISVPDDENHFRLLNPAY